MSLSGKPRSLAIGVLQPLMLRNMSDRFREENGMDKPVDKPNPAKAEAQRRAKSAINMDARERRIEKKALGARQFKKLLKAERIKHKQLQDEVQQKKLDLDTTVHIGGLSYANDIPKFAPGTGIRS